MDSSPFERSEPIRSARPAIPVPSVSTPPQLVSPSRGGSARPPLPIETVPVPPIQTAASPTGSSVSRVSSNGSSVSRVSSNGSSVSRVSTNGSSVSRVSTNGSSVSRVSPTGSSVSRVSSNGSSVSRVSTNGSSVSRVSTNGSSVSRVSTNGSSVSRVSTNDEEEIDVATVVAAVPSTTAATQFDYLRGASTIERARRDAPVWLASLGVHLFLATVLALIVFKVEPKALLDVISEPGMSDEVVLDEVFDPDAALDTNEEVEFSTDVPVESTTIADLPEVSNADEQTAAALTLADDSLGFEPTPVGEITNLLGAIGGNDYSGRGANKAAAIASGGGSEGSEKAVALALAWLAEHQRPDGSWSFSFSDCPTCRGRCSASGSAQAPFAATAMGLLPFLAAGHTAYEGKYKKTVAKGLRYLLQNGESTEMGLNFRDKSGNMYSHGLATIALCEAYAMQTERQKSRNPRLAYAARDAVRYIENAQDPDGGGWRYRPRQAGDASVVGWQVMALKSARIGGFEVSDDVLLGAVGFLRQKVGYADETRYGYTDASGGSGATTAAGLLARIYLDWRVDNPKLLRGADWVLAQSPRFNNPYFNYYATQLLHHVGGERWTRWNDATRDKLIATQTLDGHERGSWFPDGADSHCVTGGRLYATSLNCMILEIYYRHMPLYRQLETETDFPLEVPTD